MIFGNKRAADLAAETLILVEQVIDRDTDLARIFFKYMFCQAAVPDNEIAVGIKSCEFLTQVKIATVLEVNLPGQPDRSFHPTAKTEKITINSGRKRRHGMCIGNPGVDAEIVFIFGFYSQVQVHAKIIGAGDALLPVHVIDILVPVPVEAKSVIRFFVTLALIEIGP